MDRIYSFRCESFIADRMGLGSTTLHITWQCGMLCWAISERTFENHADLLAYLGKLTAYTAECVFFFFGCTFDLVSGWQCIHACAVPHPYLCILRHLRRACWTWLSKTTAKKTSVRKKATPQVIFSNKDLHPITTLYWTVESIWSLFQFYCLLFAKDNHDSASYSVF